MIQETEIKIAIDEAGISLEEAGARIAHHGFTIHKPRLFERNLVFDTATGELRTSRQLLRLRDAEGLATLTFKGVANTATGHKSREERETTVGSFGETRVILERLGYRVAFIYEKYRTEFTRPGEEGTVTVDETPVGNFLELEGEPEWIDRTAKALGFTRTDYQTASYSRIYLDWCSRHGVRPTHMQF